jgi:AraC family transcriptional regulator
MVFLELPLLQKAFEDVFRGDAPRVRLRDLSAFSDATLNGYMETFRQELMRRRASPMLVQGVAQAMAIHLARNYAETISGPQRESSALPGYKLKHLTAWMGARLDRKFDLDALAAEAGLSKFHFHRLFKTATGMTPARYQQMQRLDAARRLLRETKKSIVEIGIEVGIENPSHFAQVFRREVGLAPSTFRRQA